MLVFSARYISCFVTFSDFGYINKLLCSSANSTWFGISVLFIADLSVYSDLWHSHLRTLGRRSVDQSRPVPRINRFFSAPPGAYTLCLAFGIFIVSVSVNCVYYQENISVVLKCMLLSQLTSDLVPCVLVRCFDKHQCFAVFVLVLYCDLIYNVYSDTRTLIVILLV